MIEVEHSKGRSPRRSSSPRMRGSSTPRLLGSLQPSPEYWVPAPVRNCALGGDDNMSLSTRLRDLAARSAPELCKFAPLNERAQGMPGARCTRGLVCKCSKESAHEHTGSAEAIRHSLRNGFTAYTVLSPVNGLSCHRRRNDFHQLDASVEASGPHVFAVRFQRSRQKHRPRPPHPAFRDVAKRPSVGTGRAEYRTDLGLRKNRIFLQIGLDMPMTARVTDLPVRHRSINFHALPVSRSFAQPPPPRCQSSARSLQGGLEPKA